MKERLEISVELEEKRIIIVKGSLGERPKVTCQEVDPNDDSIKVTEIEGFYIGHLPRVIKLSTLYTDIDREITGALLIK